MSDRKVYLEERRKIPGIPDHYEISNWGRLRVLPYLDRRGFQRKAQLISCTDAQANVVINGKSKWVSIGACVLLAFVGPMPAGCRLARHLDDNRDNNSLKNLAWGTDADNIKDAQRNGRNFGHQKNLGSKRSPESLARMSAGRKGKGLGRKMTEAHKQALTAGYRARFPEKVAISLLCKCGCGGKTKPGNIFIHGHTGGRKNA